MNLHNGSIQITEFVIGGFEKVERQMEIGFVMLVVYVLIIVANTLNIVFIILDKKLHKPMYLLICNLAVVDILISSSSCPTMIGVLLAGANTISYAACLIQMFSFQVAEAMEMLALAVMALDCLIAISFPLRYHSILTNARTIAITYFLWVAACAFVTLMPVLLIPIPYCFNRLRYSFCDYLAIIRTSCHDPKHFDDMKLILTNFMSFRLVLQGMSSGSPQPLLSSATAVLLRLGNSSPQGSRQQQGVPELFLLQALANPTGQQFNSTSDLFS
ncbi:LOW QUALITY PROTEIN: putative olfactory receptor 13C6 [Gadus macrocephalus]|uniref:LOW QUALITY PROTEIN: putative olfactory receptor 13C6 n=1 Tax=Gadus macrocephalus TaxID=80720 RepID=UPI0028CB4D54|nr:LOW QUALITY PROTEIN: putative olfactory receptor 13C6 [Gadus macrocephalus]